MHSFDAHQAGESLERLFALAAWREAPFFTDAERAALALTEAATVIEHGHVPDDIWNEAAVHYDEDQLAALVLAIGLINFLEQNRGDYSDGGRLKAPAAVSAK
jgi:alkylhydroperoxidase family enzyme